MKKIIFLSAVFISFFGCKAPTEDISVNYEPVSASNTYSSGDGSYFVDKVSTSGDVELTYTLNLPSTKDVYFIFTNTSNSSTLTSPYTLSVGQADSDVVLSQSVALESVSPAIQIKEKEVITEFNNNPADINSVPAYSTIQKSIAALPVEKAVVGDSQNFYDDSGVSVPATCRAVVTDGTKTLNVFVANNCWTTTGTKTYLVTQTMVDAYAAKFLASGSGNDIYDWVTNIFGEEWGSYASLYSMLISPNDEITILLYDIDGDDNSFALGNAVTLGFFYSRDNFKNTVYSTSNQRIMFYIDAVQLACPSNNGSDSDSTWSITDFWPEYLVSTLGHEFQHMIHFYQEIVVGGNSTSKTWINEMCSLTTEDLIATKLGLDIDSVADARIPGFVAYGSSFSLNQWQGSVYNYSLAYAFGAYLLRNYGGDNSTTENGATLFQKIVQESDGTDATIASAINANGDSATSLADLLRNFGVAVVMSDKSSTTSGSFAGTTGTLAANNIALNNGSTYSSTLNSIAYTYPSLNVYEYNNQYPYNKYFYTSLSSLNSSSSGRKPMTNLIASAGSCSSGDHSWTVRMRSGIQLTVVAK